ncbi:HTH-type transcriptional regulator AcrR [Myxococcaceae bacterium]|jgi:TetR/AcrR family fatty acid metabolism transcriptional regulator|nr:HTH-type transcriptional regulator AcrR [Myxococcaceae bacterium]
MSVQFSEDGRSIRARKRSLERRAQILAAAVKTFARLGYERASIAHVCADAGIARGTLYQYFRDKKSLFREMLRSHGEKIARLMQPIEPPVPPPGDAVAMVREILRDRFERIYTVILEDREIYSILFKEALAKNADTRDVVAEIHTRMVSLMVAEMSLGRSLGIVRIDDPEFVAGFLIGGVFHTALVEIIDSELPRSPRDLSERTARFALAGLGIGA